MRASIWSSMLHALPTSEHPAALVAAGFRYSELSCEDVVDPDSGSITRTHAERLRAAADAAGLRWLQVHFPIVTCNPAARPIPGKWSRDCLTDFAHPSSERREFELHCAEELLAVCPLMGIEVMVVHPGGLSGWADRAEWEQIHTRNLEGFRRLARSAERHGVIVAIENMARAGDRVCYGADFAELAALVDAIASPNVGVCLDTSHANVMRADIPAAIRMLGKRLVATHISDNLGTHDDHLFPYSGRIAWEPVVDALRAVDYQRLFNLETPGESRCPVDVVRLKTRHARRLVAQMLGETEADASAA